MEARVPVCPDDHFATLARGDGVGVDADTWGHEGPARVALGSLALEVAAYEDAPPSHVARSIEASVAEEPELVAQDLDRTSDPAVAEVRGVERASYLDDAAVPAFDVDGRRL